MKKPALYVLLRLLNGIIASVFIIRRLEQHLLPRVIPHDTPFKGSRSLWPAVPSLRLLNATFRRENGSAQAQRNGIQNLESANMCSEILTLRRASLFSLYETIHHNLFCLGTCIKRSSSPLASFLFRDYEVTLYHLQDFEEKIGHNLNIFK